MLNILQRLIVEETGQGMVEYGLILALISLVVFTIVGDIGEVLIDTFTDVLNGFPE